MKEKILKDYYSLANKILNNYNKVKIVDNYDYSLYTIFYLNKKESFKKFKDKWDRFKKQIKEEDLNLCYEDIIEEFGKIASDFDYFELGLVDLPTDKEFELEI